ncbi:dipeptidase [Roseateles saccharophilus]|uniref:Membrane dipeptidase n=1 Tax=Roseateles saccharophilus TaxID=304 RepID=A0A4V2VQW3_ROSSA|nr:membrane dipeptidase [Roseateles saccharophilus]MDG0833061.1 peptidase M19 [Roseateles saccharophilus]TCU96259.1 membrane dipeptidase [Roseateles saccharophilus]
MKRHVINALGVLDNPNRQLESHGDDRQAMAYSSSGQNVDARSLADARVAGLTAVNITLGHVAGSAEPFEATVADIAAWDAFIRARPDALLKAHTAADLDATRDAGRIAVVYGFQNTEMLGTSLDRVALFANLGVRVIQLTYNGRNAVGDGATVADDRGLSGFGHAVVERLQAEGVLVDLSHSSEKTCLDALRAARRPLAITHTGCRAVADHPRNKSDAELRLLADKGGVVGLYFMPYLRLEGQPLAADLIAHLEHAIAVCGEDHVGLGTDGGTTAIDDMAAYRAQLAAETELRRTMGIGAPGESADISLFLPDLCGPTQFQRLAELLAARGHTAARVDKILGGNFRRLMQEAWA